MVISELAVGKEIKGAFINNIELLNFAGAGFGYVINFEAESNSEPCWRGYREKNKIRYHY